MSRELPELLRALYVHQAAAPPGELLAVLLDDAYSLAQTACYRFGFLDLTARLDDRRAQAAAATGDPLRMVAEAFTRTRLPLNRGDYGGCPALNQPRTVAPQQTRYHHSVREGCGSAGRLDHSRARALCSEHIVAHLVSTGCSRGIRREAVRRDRQLQPARVARVGAVPEWEGLPRCWRALACGRGSAAGVVVAADRS